ncbi:MAG: hypothetical protein LIP01_08595 [Tannerellaceae bacterium]|nr:hypothetical protein [Tannerellaceae bacterium]
MLSQKREKLPECILEADVLQEYTGCYSLPDGDSLNVTIEDGKIQVRTSGGYPFPIQYPTEKDKFIIQPYLNTSYCLFERGENGHVVKLSLVEGPHKTECERINN